MSDWLNDAGTETQQEQVRKALDFARLYVEVFVNSPAGARLLEHWDTTLVRKRVPVNATQNEYVATEAQRAFVQGISDQIRIVQAQGG
jgi:hypothetical protein